MFDARVVLCHVPTSQMNPRPLAPNELNLQQIMHAGLGFMDEHDELLFGPADPESPSTRDTRHHFNWEAMRDNYCHHELEVL